MRPVTHLPTCATETAGAGGLKIAETFPEGRGSPHGCGLRAVFCRDAASARPAACRDKSKVPRSGDFAGRSPGVQGAAATGRPLCAPCAIRDITQKINRERNLPGINIEVVVLPNIVRTGTFPVVPLFRRVAAAPYPAYGVYRRSSLPRPGKRCAGGQSIGAIPAISPGGGYALPGLRGLQAIFASQARQALRRRAIYRRRTRHFAGWRLRLTRPRGSCGLSLIYPLARLKLPVLAASKSLRRSRKAGAARMDAG
ncbi:transcriptional regulator (LysR family) [Klebsiella pneumoniae]|nr:transcriptional regulator (LysR family) [Klebsiella pneumoniae]